MSRKSKADKDLPQRAVRRRTKRRPQPVRKGALAERGPSERIANFAQRVLLPVLLADAARQLGHPNISPRDFYCGCAPCLKDGAPICEGRRSDCRFAGRWTPDRAAAQETAAHEARYETCWEIAMLRYRGNVMGRASMSRKP
ncbi:MAG: hypothetical protein AAFX54_18635 [Pseudomonadota bacterium]